MRRVDAQLPGDQVLLAVLALSDSAPERKRIVACLKAADLRDRYGQPYNEARVAASLAELRSAGLVAETAGGLDCVAAASCRAVSAALRLPQFDALLACIRRNWNQRFTPRDERQLRAWLRVELLSGGSSNLLRLYDLAGHYRRAGRPHVLIELLGQPFDPAYMARVEPSMREIVLCRLLLNIDQQAPSAPPLRATVEHLLDPTDPQAELAQALQFHYLLCGRVQMVRDWCKQAGDFWPAATLNAAACLLAGDTAAAVKKFEAVAANLPSALRGPLLNNTLLHCLRVLALLRAGGSAERLRAEKLVANPLAGADEMQRAANGLLLRLIHVQKGNLAPDQARLPQGERSGMLRFLECMLRYWMGLARPETDLATLEQIAAECEAGGMYWIAAQAAELLHRLGHAGSFADKARAWREEFGFDDMVGWFEPQQRWRSQLDALMDLNRPRPPAAPTRETRLVWLIDFHPAQEQIDIEPREQKLDARGFWTKGRPVALKRLHGADPQLAALTEQDRAVARAVVQESGYGQPTVYALDTQLALRAMIGHPLVFLRDDVTTRVEIVAAHAQLLVKRMGDNIRLTMPLAERALQTTLAVVQETPTRLAVVEFSEQLRSVARVIGDGVTVPESEQHKVLEAMRVLAPLLTVQSDLADGSANMPQLAADPRLHLHLLAYGSGLRMQARVRPFGNGGPYYAPGAGAAVVIAEIAGASTQVLRDIDAELAALGALQTDCPVLQQAQWSHDEWQIPDTASSLELLLQIRDLGESVVVAWPHGVKFRLAPAPIAQGLKLQVRHDADWFGLSGTLQLDAGRVLELSELLARAGTMQGRFLPLGNDEFLALTDEFRRRLENLAAVAELRPDSTRVHALASPAIAELIELAGKLSSDAAWHKQAARLRELDRLEVLIPAALATELREYQRAGYAWLMRLAHWGAGACLADDMGLGKTVQALAVLLARGAAGPALVVAPTSVCLNWAAEAARHAPSLNLRLYGPGDRAAMLEGLAANDLVVVSYGLLQIDIERFAARHWHTIVLDEAQAVKNRETRRARAVMRLQGNFRIITTGTPVENHLGELWSLFEFINPGLLGTLEQFTERFVLPIEKQADPAARAHLRRLIQPFVLRRNKSEVLAELPPRTEIQLRIELSADERAFYEALRVAALERLQDDAGGRRNLRILAEIMRLRRACCDPDLVEPGTSITGCKLAAFAELVDELLENRHKALVFSQFVDHLAILRAHLDGRGVKYLYLDGTTPAAARRARVECFQAGGADLFLISLKAGGTGINLTAADYVIHMDPWWNPAVEDQASDRAHRIGQTRPVTVYRLVAADTIEEKIVELHRHKRELADSLLAGTDGGARLSADQLLALLRSAHAAAQ
ncbi:MAG: DEAD/DEAH box helicase [Rhodocyclaceae bacterium]|nr:DEAD/DEAH box helicase [Rhodocyclaceae bacterium]MBX3666929.1 DEAD/DEAH box helicase [Rhodocyclaceae bacterium]